MLPQEVLEKLVLWGHALWGFVRGDVKFWGRVLVSGELLTDSFG